AHFCSLGGERAYDRCAKGRVIECYRPETVIPAAVGVPGARQWHARARPRRHRSSRAVVRLCKGRCYRPAAVGLCACRQPYRCGVRSVLGRTRSIAGGAEAEKQTLLACLGVILTAARAAPY